MRKMMSESGSDAAGDQRNTWLSSLGLLRVLRNSGGRGEAREERKVGRDCRRDPFLTRRATIVVIYTIGSFSAGVDVRLSAFALPRFLRHWSNADHATRVRAQFNARLLRPRRSNLPSEPSRHPLSANAVEIDAPDGSRRSVSDGAQQLRRPVAH